MDKKLFGKLNIIDIIIVAVLVIALAGVIFVKFKNRIASPEAAKETKKVEIDVMLQRERVSADRELFKVGERSFMTIRNVPHAKLEIIKVSKTSVKMAIPDPQNPQKAISVDDPAMPNTYDYIVTLTDNAVITNDGAVVGGNKIKIGLPIVLEGFDYRLAGVVSNVRIME
jgi:hypothetical protein